MVQRVLTTFLCAILLGSTAWAQADLTEVKKKILYEQLSDAEADLKKFVAEGPKNLDEVYYWLGYVNYLRGNFGDATAAFQNGISHKKKSPYANAGMGLMKLQEGDKTAAREFLELAFASNKGKDIYADFEIAKAYLKGDVEDIGEAKVILYQARDKNPDLPETYILLGEYYKVQKVPELAIEEFEKAKQKDPGYVKAYVALAELYYEQKEFQKGFENVQEAIKLDPEYGPAYRIRGELYLLVDKDKMPNKFELARNDLKKYVDIAQNDVTARIRYASFLFLTEDYQEMLDELTEIEKIKTTRVMRRLKGLAYNKLGQYDKAQAAMDDYFKNSEEKYTIAADYEAYGDILRNKGDFDKADEYYEQAIEKDLEREGIWEEIAEEYEDMSKAVKREAKQLDNQYKTTAKEYNQRAKAYQSYVNQAKQAQADGDAEKAKELVEKAKEQQAMMEEVLAKVEEQKPLSDQKKMEAVQFYGPEIHYRKAVLEHSGDRKSLQMYYKLATAQYNLGIAKTDITVLEEANENFKKVHEFKDDYFAPYSRRMQIAQIRENADTTSLEWFLKDVAEDIVTVYEPKDPSGLKKSEKTGLLTSYEILANYQFNPNNSAEGPYDCDSAKPFIDKIYEIEPAYTRIKGLADFCEAQGGKR